MENNEAATGDFETQNGVMYLVCNPGSQDSPLMVLNLKVSIVTLLGCLG